MVYKALSDTVLHENLNNSWNGNFWFLFCKLGREKLIGLPNSSSQVPVPALEYMFFGSQVQYSFHESITAKVKMETENITTVT